jgi:hypothetical protein
MNDLALRYALRGIAIAIALGALIDPAIDSNRSERPVVVVASLDSMRDAPLVNRVAKTLEDRFDVSRASIAGASATVLIADRPPRAIDEFATPVFAVLPDTLARSVAIQRIELPATVPSDSRVPVMAQVAVDGANAQTLDVTLRAGSVVVDHLTRRVGRGDTTLSLPLSFVPTALGATALRVTAKLTGASADAVADVATDVRDHRWSVLFHDPRPSWTSTFVRRSIERDPRFIVTSRVETSRGVSTDAGRPPAQFDDVAAWDVIVVGAPEGLSATDVAELDAFMRRRGGSVVFLLDQRIAAPYDRLTGVASWTTHTTTSTALVTMRHDSATLRAGEIAFPTTLPAGAITIAGGPLPVVWETAVGAGRLVVSGALDSWRFRDPSTSGFDTFWRQTLAEAADAAPPPISVATSTAITSPGEWLDVRAVIRSAALSPPFSNGADTRSVRVSVAARVERVGATSDGDQQTITVHLLPGSAVGEFTARLRAPRAPGSYRIVVASDTMSAEMPLIVSQDWHGVQPSAHDLVGPWARAHGGRAFGATEVDALLSTLASAVPSPVRLENWHPMRSAWWILPFALALSGEWWLRRRRGLA